MDVLEQSSVYPAYYALYALSAELLVLHGGVYIGQNLNTLQAKRLTPLIFGGYQFGMMLGGLLLINVVADVGLNSAPLAWPGVCACCWPYSCWRGGMVDTELHRFISHRASATRASSSPQSMKFARGSILPAACRC